MPEISTDNVGRPGRSPYAPAASPTRLADAGRALVGLWSLWHAQRTQWRSPEQLQAWQGKRLGALVRHAHETVPFYRRLYDRERVDPAAIRSLADLAQLPIVTKAQLQAELEDDLLSRDRRKSALVSSITSGSTGRPFRTYRDPWLERWRAGYLLRALGTAGYRLGDRLLMVVERAERPGTGWTRWRKLTFYDPVDHVLAEINRLRPAIVYGYVSVLRQVVRLAQERGVAIHRPKAVVTVSETLDPITRQRLGDGFGAPVFDIYGSIEMGVIAWECQAHDGYHVAEDSVLLETLAADRGSQRLILTNLNNEAMPLIRYDQGDFALSGDGPPCPCGRRFRRLAAIQGRVMDSIVRPDGSHVPPFSVTSAISEIPGVRRFQIVQEPSGMLMVRVENARPLSAEITGQIERDLGAVLGPGMRIATEAVTSLEPPPGVKFRLIESKLGKAAH